MFDAAPVHLPGWFDVDAAAPEAPEAPEAPTPTFSEPGPHAERPLAPAATREASSAPDFARVARTLAHELRNPLVPVQTLAALGDAGDDPDHQRLREQVRIGVDRIEDLLERLTAFSALSGSNGGGTVAPVDLSQLLEALLQERRDAIQERRLLVMRHLETERPEALGTAGALRFAFASLLDAVMQGSRERGDLYIASRHHPTGLQGGPAMRVLLRFHGDPAAANSAAAHDVDPRQNSLDWMLAEAALRRCGGVLAIDAAAGADENVVDVTLPAPPRH